MIAPENGLERKKIIYTFHVMIFKGMIWYVLRKYISVYVVTLNVTTSGMVYLLTLVTCIQNWYENSIFQTIQVCHDSFVSACF